MSVSSNDFLIQGLRLLKGECEIDQRSAISRSYYAAYHAALQAATRLRLPPGDRSDVGAHERLIRKFEGQGKGLKKIARSLRDKKRMRGVADYQLEELVLLGEAEMYVKEVRMLATELNRLGTNIQEVND